MSIVNVNNDWAIIDTGAATNGGCFDRTSGNTDYSQQDSPVLALADVATDGAGTGISSTTGGFTAAMVDNGVYLSGTGAGRYQLVSVTDTNNATIDRSAGASQSGLTCNVGGSISVLTDAIAETFYKGNGVYLKKGTFALTQNVLSSINGSPADGMLLWEGYKTTRGDAPTDPADMPFISCGAYYVSINHWNVFKNISMSGTAAYVLYMNNRSNIQNCKIENTSGVGDRRAVFCVAATHATVIECELISTNGSAIYPSNCDMMACDIHASDVGIAAGVDYTATDCQIYDCATQGITLSNNHITLKNNTIYDCNDGIYASSSTNDIGTIINNNIVGNVVGVNSGTLNKSIFLDRNNFWDNGTDVINVVKGANATATNPNFADGANGDFVNNLPANALPVGTFPAGNTANFLSQGASQQAAGAAGGVRVFVHT